jgi:glycosyltransferase involved in cell wall biosynthesis
MSKTKVAFFLPSLEGGGVERMAINLATGLLLRGYAVDFVLVHKTGSLLEIVPADARVIDLQASRALTAILGLSHYLRTNQPQALIAAPHHANLIAIWAKLLASARTKIAIGTYTNYSLTLRYTRKIQERVYPPLLRLFHHYSDAIIAVSEGAADDLARVTHIPRGRITVIYNPAITKEIEPLSQEPLDHPWFQPDSPPVILAAGRLNVAKDYPTLLKAFAGLRNRRPAKLVILGEGEKRAELTTLSEKLHITNDVDLPGFVLNPFRFMARCKVFVLSSIYEGFSCVIAEALACGAQVVSTDCPSGPAEILEHGRYGRLVPVGDPVALAEAMEQALMNPLPSDFLRRRAQFFSADRAIDQYLSALGLT